MERTNWTLEYMLCMYAMSKPTKWEDYPNLVEFAHNNGYQASLKMSLFEALYNRTCNTLVIWSNPTNIFILGWEMLKEME
jgi:hypothetical protein